MTPTNFNDNYTKMKPQILRKKKLPTCFHKYISHSKQGTVLTGLVQIIITIKVFSLVLLRGKVILVATYGFPWDK